MIMLRLLILFLLGTVWLWGCGENPTDSEEVNQPSPPHDLQAIKFSDGEVVLVWGESDGEDMAGYNVYRSEDMDRDFEKVDFVSQTRFYDTDLEYDMAYFYQVVAVNSQGIESAPLFVSGRPLNNLWPATPKGIRAEARNLSGLGYGVEIELRWEANTEADLESYRVYGSTERNFHMDETTMIAEVELPWFNHTDLEVGTTYYYQVTAMDRGGLESVAAQSAVELLEPLQLEQPVNGLYAESKPMFVWKGVPMVRPYTKVRYTVSLASGPLSRELWVGEVEGNDTRVRYSGSKLDAGTYWWKVLVEVFDESNSAVSITLSSLEHFRVR
jgi:hypothetical protein